MIGSTAVPVIDAHVHTFPETIAAGAVGKLAAISGITPATDGTVAATRRKMAETGIDGAVFLNIATAPKQQHTINNCAAQVTSESGGRILSLGSVHPEAENAVAELRRIASLGIRGIKLHPDYQGFMIDDERAYPIYDACQELGLPIVFHSGWDCYSPDLIHAAPEASRRVVRDFPRLKIVLAHFGGLRLWDDVERFLIGEHVWLDTSMCATFADPAQIARMIRGHDPAKILFGSDCPWEQPEESLRFLLSLEIPDAWKVDILSKNVRIFYGWNSFPEEECFKKAL